MHAPVFPYIVQSLSTIEEFYTLFTNTIVETRVKEHLPAYSD